MTEKKITEHFGKRLLYSRLSDDVVYPQSVSVEKETSFDELAKKNPWLLEEKLVVKPDQGIKSRSANGLIRINVTYDEARKWVEENMVKEVKYKDDTCILKQFIIEPFVPHDSADEHYIAIYSELDSDVILFHLEGGVDVGDVDKKAQRLEVAVHKSINEEDILTHLLPGITSSKSQTICKFIQKLHEAYREMHFTLLEINPFIVKNDKIIILDVAAVLDSKAQNLCQDKWGDVQWAKTMGREQCSEERQIERLEKESRGSVKLTIINKKGRIWCGIGGGGTSLLFGDTLHQMGLIDELGCYAQFAGNTTSETMYGFFKTIFDAMMENKDPRGKVLITGSQGSDMILMMHRKLRNGPGIYKILDEYKEKLIEHKISIYFRTSTHLVDQENEKIPEDIKKLGISMYIMSGEVPIKDMIEYALNIKEVEGANYNKPVIYRKILTPAVNVNSNHLANYVCKEDTIFASGIQMVAVNFWDFAIQKTVDYDFVCSRKTPSIAAIVRPNSEVTEERYKWGDSEVTIPVYGNIEDAMNKHSEISVVANFAFGPVAYKIALASIKAPQITCVILMAGHLPLNQIRDLIYQAKQSGVMLIGPTVPKHGLQVCVIKPGVMRCNMLGNVGGPKEDIVSLNLHKAGSVVLLSRSGGLALTLCVSIARNSDGLYIGICLGGGRYTGTGFMDHILSLHDNPAVKTFVLIGEVGGLEEYEVCEALMNGQITKPVIAFCSGTSVSHFQKEPAFFGHTGGGIDIKRESAIIKNQALAEAGAIVPDNFDGITIKLAEIYDNFAAEEAKTSVMDSNKTVAA